MPPALKDGPATRSCLRCHERKVRCDRNYPCSRCLQTQVKCSYPEHGRAPRKLKRPPIATILGQLKHLEQEVERLRALTNVREDDSITIQQPHCGASQDVQTQAKIPDSQASPSSPRNRHQVLNMTARSLPIGSTGYFGPGAQPSTEASDLHKLRPPQLQALWEIYKENVAPMIALLHKRTMAVIIQEACTKATSNVGLTLDPLVLTICFAAAVSATPAQCLSIFGQDRESCVHASRLAVEQALTQSDLISAKDFHVLQAAVLFLLCLRWLDPKPTWAQTAIVIRVAQKQGVHRDGELSGLSPFDTEMRRRLWWHICILDMLCSEDQEIDTQIRPEMFNTKTPSNIDIDSLAPDMLILPPPQTGFSDITLCNIQCEMMINLYWASINLNPEAAQPSLPERENTLCSLATRMILQFVEFG